MAKTPMFSLNRTTPPETAPDQHHREDARLRIAKRGTTRHTQAGPRPDDAISLRSGTETQKGLSHFYVVDGGCSGNGTGKGIAYGSWCRVEEGVIVAHRTFPLPDAHTNNEAEYQALLELLPVIESESEVRMDSQLVVNQLVKGWGVKAANLRPLMLRAKQLAALKRVFLVWTPRENVEAYLGH